MGEHPGHHAGGQGVVDGVEAGRLHLDQDGAVGDLGDGQVGQLRSRTGDRDVQRAHGVLPK